MKLKKVIALTVMVAVLMALLSFPTNAEAVPITDLQGHTHNYSYTTVPATVSDYGYTVGVCNCGHTVKTNQVNPIDGADPYAIEPSSNRVVFIADPPRDPDTHEIIGELQGDGSGTSPDNPLSVLEHADYNADAEVPRYHLQTSFYQATEILRDTGGTIVITGPIYLGRFESYGASNNIADVFTAAFKHTVIKFTSVYNGVDYRKTNGAKIIIERPAAISVLGSSIWEDIDIETIGTNRVISFDGHCTRIGEGVKCYPADSLLEGDPAAYVSLAAGHRYSSSTGQKTMLLVQSGTYNNISGGIWGAVQTHGMTNATTNIILEGSTEVKGNISGSVNATSFFSGHTNIIINSGTYSGNIYGASQTGFEKPNGSVRIKLRNGNFKDIQNICVVADGHNNYKPLYSVLDMSEWRGSVTDLAFAYCSTMSPFTDELLPTGISVDYLLTVYNSYITKNGWVEHDGIWYYYDNGIMVTNDWKHNGMGWRFLGEDGKSVTDLFAKDSTGKWAYISSNGYYNETTGWLLYQDCWYYLEKGYRVENDWRKDSTGWCFLDEEGRWVLNSFVKDSTDMWAYITPDGYYYETTGWIQYDGGWYYLEKGYAVTSQWRKDSVGWCYLSESGRMVTNAFVPDSMGLCWIGGEGYMLEVTDWQLYNDQWYYLQNGYAVTNDWRLDSKGWCYLCEDGAMLTSTWLKDSVGWCYIDENGYCLANGTYEVDGHEYTFDADGRIQGEPIQE